MATREELASYAEEITDRLVGRWNVTVDSDGRTFRLGLASETDIGVTGTVWTSGDRREVSFEPFCADEEIKMIHIGTWCYRVPFGDLDGEEVRLLISSVRGIQNSLQRYRKRQAESTQRHAALQHIATEIGTDNIHVDDIDDSDLNLTIRLKKLGIRLVFMAMEYPPGQFHLDGHVSTELAIALGRVYANWKEETS